MKFGSERLVVLHYSSIWLPKTETWLHDQLTQLPEWIESHVFCETTGDLDRFAVPNLHCFSELPPLPRYWDKTLRKLGIRNYIGDFVVQARKVNPDIVHSHFGHVGWANLKAVNRSDARHIATFYGLDVSRLPSVDPRWRSRYIELFSKIDRVLCEGPHMASCIRKLGCPPEKVCVHHLGVRVDEIPYRPRTWDRRGPLRVLIAATFREKKGIPYALAALGELQRDVPLEVTLVGDASEEPRSQTEKGRILAALEKHNLQSHTRLRGFCTYEELMIFAYDHHIFLSPSVTASDGDTEGGAPIGIIHMAASGMPIVSTRHCDIPNVLPAPFDLADERDVAGLVSRLRRLVESAGNWEPELGRVRRHVEVSFNAGTQGLQLAAIYASICGRSVPPAPQRAISMAI